MEAPAQNIDPVADARTWARWCARASILLPMAALLVMFATRQLERKKSPEVAARIDLVGSVISGGLVVLGPVLGVAGIVGGRRRRSRDTVTIAGLGLFLSGLLLVLTVWAIVFVAQARSGTP